jgi:clorobiocin biosynthesis protein CloN5
VKQAEVELALMEFIREEFLWGDDDRELTESTPLLEWGIIDSLRTALLLTHMREKLGVFVSPAKINARNFRDVTSIAALVVAEAAVAADTTQREPA